MANEAPYKLSRASMRERWGTRAIDASAPQSELDTTPSGRQRRMEQQGFSQDEIREREDKIWEKKFRPMDLVRRPAPQSPLESIQRANEAGMVNASFDTPYGPVSRGAGTTPSAFMEGSFQTPAYRSMSMPSLMPTESVTPATDDYTAGASRYTPPLFSFQRQRKRGSILDGAERWLSTV